MDGTERKGGAGGYMRGSPGAMRLLRCTGELGPPSLAGTGSPTRAYAVTKDYGDLVRIHPLHRSRTSSRACMLSELLAYFKSIRWGQQPPTKSGENNSAVSPDALQQMLDIQAFWTARRPRTYMKNPRRTVGDPGNHRSTTR